MVAQAACLLPGFS